MSNTSYCQTAWVVEDLDRVIEHFVDALGVGPFFVMRHVENEIEYRGQPSKPEISLALAQMGPMQIELIQQHNNAGSPWLDVASGLAVVHHIARTTETFDHDIERCAGRGIEVVHRATYGSIRNAYLDTRRIIGCMTELIELGPDIAEQFTTVADAGATWDGNEPVRVLTM